MCFLELYFSFDTARVTEIVVVLQHQDSDIPAVLSVHLMQYWFIYYIKENLYKYLKVSDLKYPVC